MAEKTKIEWCDHTVNLWWGCTKVHAGCDHCYAETLSHRWGDDVWGNDKPRRRIKSAFNDLKKYQIKASKEGIIYKIFVGSMMDIFEKPMPLQNPDEAKRNTTHLLRRVFFANISLNWYPNLMFLCLTKRPSNINKYMLTDSSNKYPPNVMFGTSPCNQKTFDILVPQLLKVPGKKFLSVEPQLGMIDNIDLSGIDWVIQGGESGPKKRPFNLEWARRMRDICKEQNVPYFFKQIDKIQPIPKDLQIRQFPD
ncbi:hypothetical protein LCGC14_1323660 [marine sediment metagenome]|uniref:Phage Gp37Gp68 family protein n=1 Tax=marine sediment metagenome TaxID=412755 RepID=A0A0F9NL45_9ZZZZ|nr:DUF5131 family protein [Pricia sp.]